MVQRDDDRHYRLSKGDRENLRWNQTTSRRQSIPSYPNSLSMADTRVRRCETCRKWFSSVDDMRKHISLTHTGTKPIVCQICGKRFGKSQQMIAHYKMHREARLQEFSILTKRRQHDVVSELSDTSHTRVGSFQKVSKRLKSHVSGLPEVTKSYGTRQSFQVSKNGASETKIPGHAESENIKAVRIANKTSAHTKKEFNSITESVTLPKINSKQSIPTPDPGHISLIENVMGVSRAIETSRESLFVENAEEEFVRSRMEAMSLAGRSPSPKSFKTRSGLTDYMKPKYLIDKEFWDSGSHTTERMTGYSPVSGYDPYIQELNSREKRRTSAFSFPSIRRDYALK